MDIEEIIQVIVDNGKIEDMHELSDILEDTIEIIKDYDNECYKEFEMKLYEMAYGKKLTDDMKREWVKKMRPMPKWSEEEVQEIYSKYVIEMPFYSFFVIINMMYSDMGKILGTENDNETLIKYIEASQNWYFDEDTINTQEAKLYNYWKYIVN